MSEAPSLLQQLAESAAYIKNLYPSTVSVGVILGSGLSDFTSGYSLEKLEKEISYSNIPHFPVSTVSGHSGKLFFCEINKRKVIVMAGRFHFYEGYAPQQVAYPVYIMKMLGVHTILISNAAGGVGENLNVGDLMIIKDHISFFIHNPLIGKNENTLGTRFPDMSEPYNKDLIAKAKKIGERLGYNLKEGIYAGVTGPSFETRAEYKLLRTLGADAVGMSTVQEVIAAVHAGMKVFALSVITDIGIREEENIITHEEVLLAAKNAAPRLSALLHEMIAVV